MSFPGEKREFVDDVVNVLRPTLKKTRSSTTMTIKLNYQGQISTRYCRTSILQDIYRNKSELIVVFLCKGYAQKQWCGLEWRAIRDIIKSKEDDRVMFVRFDNAPIDGVFSLDGYIDGNNFSAKDVANFISERLASLPKRSNEDA
jgi:hypothetical protein